jgi:uncharacterized protein (TIGR02594 family)
MKKNILIVALAIAPFAFADLASAKPSNENTQYSQETPKKKVVKKKKAKKINAVKVAPEHNPVLKECGFFDFSCNVQRNEEIAAASSKTVALAPKPTETIYSYNTTEESAGEYWRKEWARVNPPVKAPVDKPKQNNKVVVRRDCLFCEDKSGTYAEAKKWEGKNSRNKEDRKELTMLFNESTIPPIDPGKLPWCAAFANSILNKLGLEGTNSLMARSFLNYGAPTKNPQVGDIVVTKRGSGNVAGHVGFFEGYEVVDGITYVKIFGGNTDKMVSTGWFPVTAVLGFRKIPQYS